MLNRSQGWRIIHIFQGHIDAAEASLSIAGLCGIVKAGIVPCIICLRLKMHNAIAINPATAMPEVAQSCQREGAPTKATQHVIGQQVTAIDDGLGIFKAVNAVTIGLYCGFVIDA